MAEDRSVRGNTIKPKKVEADTIEAQEIVGEIDMGDVEHVEDLTTEGAEGTVPTAQADGSLSMSAIDSHERYTDQEAKNAVSAVDIGMSVLSSGEMLKDPTEPSFQVDYDIGYDSNRPSGEEYATRVRLIGDESNEYTIFEELAGSPDNLPRVSFVQFDIADSVTAEGLTVSYEVFQINV